MSFRPLFASGADIAEPTEEFEQVFGQSSGAWIVAILENGGSSKPEFVRATARLSELARDIPQVTEVLSLTTLRIPQWHRSALSFVAPIPAYLLDPAEQEELESQYDDLLDGTRFVNWLVSADGRRLLLAARLDLPLDDLDGRRGVVNEFEALLRAKAPADINLYFSGVSVVELAYERQVLEDQLIATAITSVVLMLLLFWTFGNVRSVLVCLTPVTLAIPATLGIMGWLGQPVTIINTVIPAIILVIGVAENQANRRMYEAALAQRLEEHGVTAYQSVMLLPTSEKLQKEDVVAAVKEKNIDAVLVTRVLDINRQKNYVPPSTTVYSAYPGYGHAYYGSYYGYYHHSYSVVTSPGYTYTDVTVILETNLYDASNENIAWSGQSATFNPEDVHEVIGPTAKLIVNKLIEEGFIQ